MPRTNNCSIIISAYVFLDRQAVIYTHMGVVSWNDTIPRIFIMKFCISFSEYGELGWYVHNRI